jgi:hypothetical protein
MNFSLLDNPIWNSLNSDHRSLATLHKSAGRFSPDVSPLVGMLDGSESSFNDLALVLSDGTGGGTFTAYPITVPAGWEARQRVIDQWSVLRWPELGQMVSGYWGRRMFQTCWN